MIRKFLTIGLFVISVSSLLAQNLKPAISFDENPKSYCMHICSDGESYFTVNGGVAKVGKITQYSLDGAYTKAFSLPLDMRSIFYCSKNKSLYFNTTDKQIYRIIDLMAGTYELVFSDLYENKQASLALDPSCKFLYIFDNGTLFIHKFKDGSLIKSISGLKCGDGNRDGGATIAIDRKKNIYTWDANSKTIYMYNKEGTFIKEIKISDGDFGYSLSYANKMIFVSHSPKNKKGKWFGYILE